MKVTIDFANRRLVIVYSDGSDIAIPLNLLSVFLLANLLCTVTWVVPMDFKEKWIKDLQKHLDMAEEAEFESHNVSNNEKEK